jgi:hypothetical protein
MESIPEDYCCVEHIQQHNNINAETAEESK